MVRFAIERDPQAAGRQNSLERKGVEGVRLLGSRGLTGSRPVRWQLRWGLRWASESQVERYKEGLGDRLMGEGGAELIKRRHLGRPPSFGWSVEWTLPFTGRGVCVQGSGVGGGGER